MKSKTLKNKIKHLIEEGIEEVYNYGFGEEYRVVYSNFRLVIKHWNFNTLEHSGVTDDEYEVSVYTNDVDVRPVFMKTMLASNKIHLIKIATDKLVKYLQENNFNLGVRYEV